MEIVLPRKQNSEEPVKLSNPHNLIIIGANGTGKSRFGDELAKCSAVPVHRVTAFDAIARSTRWTEIGQSGTPAETTGFEYILGLLCREEYERMSDYKEALRQNDGNRRLPVTSLDKTRRIWEKIFTVSHLRMQKGELEVQGESGVPPYPAIEMSQGERVVFYFIASVLTAVPKALIIVEDPEIYLHRSIINTLWDAVEQSRPDCTFVYLTHDIEFAAARSAGVRIWVKSVNTAEQSWDYELLEDQHSFSEDIYLELLGSRKPVLFVEGTDNASIDIRLYPYIFPDYLVKPLGSCTKVIEITRAFSEMKGFHHLESRGIVDRDRRTHHEILFLRKRNVYVPEVAEVENLLMLKEVIMTVARRMLQDPAQVFASVSENVVKLFEKDLDAQALLHTRHYLRREIEYRIDRRLNNIDEVAAHIGALTADIDSRKLYEEFRSEFRGYVEAAGYDDILRVYNQKGMLPQSRVTQLCGIAGKEKYLDFVLSILNENKEDAQIIRSAIQRCFGL